MIEGRARATIHASAQECYQFVLDLDRYRQADHKIGRVRSLAFDEDTTEVEHVEQLSFRGPARPLFERLLRDWLAQDTPAEVARMKALLEQ